MAQSQNGGDIFLAGPKGNYLGRTCHWKNCGPGIRMSCDALHCGQRHYLHDDLRNPIAQGSHRCISLGIVAATGRSGSSSRRPETRIAGIPPTGGASVTQPNNRPRRHRFILNPYSEERFAFCPDCDGPTEQRKFPLLIHVEPRNPVALNKTCCYCGAAT